MEQQAECKPTPPPEGQGETINQTFPVKNMTKIFLMLSTNMCQTNQVLDWLQFPVTKYLLL